MSLPNNRMLILTFFAGAAAGLVALALVALAWGAVGDLPLIDLESENPARRQQQPQQQQRAPIYAEAPPALEGLTVERVIGPEELLPPDIPTFSGNSPVATLAPLADGRLLFSDLEGRVGVLAADGGIVRDFIDLDAHTLGEWGHISMEASAEHEGLVYAFLISEVAGQLGQPQLVSFDASGASGAGIEVVSEDFPVVTPDLPQHTGGALTVGSDRLLYLAIGDGGVPTNAQAITTVLGKVLRVTSSGEAAPGNPYSDVNGADPRIFAVGIRNVFDMAEGPGESIYFTQNGPAVCDRIDILSPAANYGWNGTTQPPSTYVESSCQIAIPTRARLETFAAPVWDFHSTPTGPGEAHAVAPVGMAFVPEGTFPGIGDSLAVCEFNTSRLVLLTLAADGLSIDNEALLANDCLLAVEFADGVLYYSTPDGVYAISPEG